MFSVVEVYEGWCSIPKCFDINVLKTNHRMQNHQSYHTNETKLISFPLSSAWSLHTTQWHDVYEPFIEFVFLTRQTHTYIRIWIHLAHSLSFHIPISQVIIITIIIETVAGMYLPNVCNSYFVGKIYLDKMVCYMQPKMWYRSAHAIIIIFATHWNACVCAPEPLNRIQKSIRYCILLTKRTKINNKNIHKYCFRKWKM